MKYSVFEAGVLDFHLSLTIIQKTRFLRDPNSLLLMIFKF